MQHQIIYLTEIDKAQAAGLPWQSVHAARWDYRHRIERGTAGAFLNIGSRVAVDPDRYHELVRRGQAA
jgi:hypothetical protein